MWTPGFSSEYEWRLRRTALLGSLGPINTHQPLHLHQSPSASEIHCWRNNDQDSGHMQFYFDIQLCFVALVVAGYS